MKHPTCEKLDRLTSQLQVVICTDLDSTWVKYVHMLYMIDKFLFGPSFFCLISTDICGVGAVATRIPRKYI